MIADRNFNVEEMTHFLNEMNEEFMTPLDAQVSGQGLSMKEYAYKLCSKGTIAYVKESFDLLGIVVGYAHDTPDESSYITQVVVSPKARGKGVCGRLLAEYCAFCGKLGLDSVWLTTEADNHSARKAYEKFGFHLEDEKEGIVRYRIILEELLMRSDLLKEGVCY